MGTVPFIHSIRIRYAETDRMGIAHHSMYAVYMEEARTEYMRAMGFSYAQAETEGIMLPLRQLSCQYKSPVTYDDTLDIAVRMAAFRGARLTLSYEMTCAGRLVALGETVHAITDTRLVPVNLRRVHPALYAAFSRALEEQAEKEE